MTIATSRTLLKPDAGSARGIPATIPARTAVDLAAVLAVPHLRNALIDGAQRRCFTYDQVEHIRHRVRPCPGGPKLDGVLRDLRQHGSDSDFEFEVRRFLHHHDFEPYPQPFPFRTSRARIVHFDIAFPHHWVCCECDSMGHHADRIGFQRDRWKWSQATIDGWAVYWIEWTRWKNDPMRIVHDLRTLLAAADPTRAPAVAAA